MKELNSSVIGVLKQNPRFDDWWESDKLPIPFFNGSELPITFMDFDPCEDTNFLIQADDALKAFLEKDELDRLNISTLVFQECDSYWESIIEPHTPEKYSSITDAMEIWRWITPIEIYITRRPYNDQDLYLIVACECDWDEEHGLQLVFRRGKQITRVSSQDGHLTEADADDKPDSEDELLKKFELEN